MELPLERRWLAGEPGQYWLVTFLVTLWHLVWPSREITVPPMSDAWLREHDSESGKHLEW